MGWLAKQKLSLSQARLYQGYCCWVATTFTDYDWCFPIFKQGLPKVPPSRLSSLVSAYVFIFLCQNDQAYNCLIHFYKRYGSDVMHHKSFIMYHASWIMYRASCIMHHAYCIMHHSSCIMHHTSYKVHHASGIRNHGS